jgi:hypothetical protein
LEEAALKIICTEQPEVAWKLLESLLPNQHLTTSGTHKPSDVGQLIYTMHPTAAYDLAQIGLNNDQIEVYLSMLWKLAKVNGDSYPPKMRA